MIVLVCPQYHYAVLHLYCRPFKCSALIVNQCLFEMKEIDRAIKNEKELLKKILKIYCHFCSQENSGHHVRLVLHKIAATRTY